MIYLIFSITFRTTTDSAKRVQMSPTADRYWKIWNSDSDEAHRDQKDLLQVPGGLDTLIQSSHAGWDREQLVELVELVGKHCGMRLETTWTTMALEDKGLSDLFKARVISHETLVEGLEKLLKNQALRLCSICLCIHTIDTFCTFLLLF